MFRNCCILFVFFLNVELFTADVLVSLPFNTDDGLSNDSAKCAVLLKTFAQSASNLTMCSILYARPVRLCEKCVNEYVNFVLDFNELLSAEDNGTSCRSIFISRDRLDAVLDIQIHIASVWDKGNCNNCFEWDGSIPTTSNNTRKFDKMYNHTMDCILDNLNKYGNNTDKVCENCMQLYEALDEFYMSLSSDGIGVDSVCMDVVDLEQEAPTRTPYPGRSSALRLAYQRRGFPTIAWDLMLSSLSKNTIQQYNVSLNLWWSFCTQHNKDVFDSSIALIMTFLTEQFNRGASYGSINSHRSALSLFLGDNIGKNEHIKRLLKGVYKMRPNVPKYTHTWDPKIVLDHIGQWYPNTTIFLEQITKKLVVLLALCTAHRVQTLSLIKLRNIHFGPNGVKIIISDIIKTSAAGREQPILFLPFFEEKPEICAATALRDYLSMTSDKRPQNSEHLLITVKRPHRDATAQSISRWIKQVLADSGVDVAIFSAHSTRHAATSTAAAAGVNVDLIRKTAGWTTTSQTFAKFYHRQIIDEGTFARSVCN